jgi:hypothetical protein
VADGQELRRHFDLASAANKAGADGSDFAESDELRQAVVARLAQLQETSGPILEAWEPADEPAAAVSREIQRELASALRAFRTLMADATRDAVRQATALDGLRSDLEWLEKVIARHDGERPPRSAARLEVELERVRRLVAAQDGPEAGKLTSSCRQMQATLLERRVRSELERPALPEGAAPEAFWTRRLLLSRLQAHVQAIAPEGSDTQADVVPPGMTRPPFLWIDELSKLRDRLADRAELAVARLPIVERAEAAEQIVRTAHDDVNETIAFLEDLTLPRAVLRLELVLVDLERLRISTRVWSHPGATGEPASGSWSESAESAESTPLGQAEGTAATTDSDSSAAEPSRRAREAADARLARQGRKVARLVRQVRGEWQEKLLASRMEARLGRPFLVAMENTVLVLIVALTGLIASELVLEQFGPLRPDQHEFFAWTDLAICSVFLAEFGLKLSLAPRKGLYLVRHLLIDLLPSIPFGFLWHQAELIQAGASASSAMERLLRLGRFAQLLRYIRVSLPALRLIRVALFVLRFNDRMVRRLAGFLNRNIILFEPSPARQAESRLHYRLSSLRLEIDQTMEGLESRLDEASRRAIAARRLSDLRPLLRALPPHAVGGETEEGEGREIPVEAVVERLIHMTPERLVDRMGPAFIASADRYLRLLDAPLVRRFPLIRRLVAHREKTPAEAVTLAVNHVGHLIQGGLDGIYFLADLHGTVSPPVFLDRLGATIINATRTPAKRLLVLGSAFLFLFVTVQSIRFLAPFRGFVVKIQNLLGWPVIGLGAICLGLWVLGAWFRKIANQSADFCERIVEAQFASQTKTLKARRREQDARFLAERVIDPELLLRASDDRIETSYRPRSGRANGYQFGGAESDLDAEDDARTEADQGTSGSERALFENRELAFLRNVRLLYQDYLDGSPLHRSDTKASIQLLGNLALANLRRSHLPHLLRESRALDRLDLSRAGGLLGGPYLWFNYITRMIVQDTALLLLDYNRHAIPVDRLSCAPAAARARFRQWLARRLKIDEDDVWLPGPTGDSLDSGSDTEPTKTPAKASTPDPNPDLPANPPAKKRRFWLPGPARRRREADLFLETVEFTAIDFLSDEPARDEEIHARFGPQVAELVRRDRQQNVRRAFRSFPLHELPLSQRTINPFALYEMYLSRGRVVVLPFLLLGGLARSILSGVRIVSRVVRDILNPRVDEDRDVPADTYWAALRKIHRMRKPIFMSSLWLRARFDVEYLGLPLPSAPASIAGTSFLETDLDFIGATRRDRVILEQIRAGHQRRLEWIARWLDRFGWTFAELPHRLLQDAPFLMNRGGEALRAIVAACILDHDDIATLALSIEALDRILAYAAEASSDPGSVPVGLPDPVESTRLLWRPIRRLRRPVSDLFRLPCFPQLNRMQQRRVLRYLRRHRRLVRGWIRVVLGQGGDDPWDVVRRRLREVLIRTDLWSDQILVLRAVQTLTMLDVQHNCELVWSLGGYEDPLDEESAAPVGPEIAPLVDVDDEAIV